MKTFIKTLFKAVLAFTAFSVVVLILAGIFADTSSDQVAAASSDTEIKQPESQKENVLEGFKKKLQERSNGSVASQEVTERIDLDYTPSAWSMGRFVDNFGDATNEKYIKTEVDGFFSNSATSNSYLFVRILFKKDIAGILLHEYRKSSPPQKFIGNAQLQMKNSSGEQIIINTSGEWNQQGGISVDNWPQAKQYNFSRFRNFLKKVRAL